MRVLYSFPHPLGSTGIGMTAWHHVDALARSGATVVAVCTRLHRRFDPTLPVRVVETLGPVRPRMIGRTNAYRLHDRRCARMVARLRPDVVHTWPRAVVRTAAMARRHGVPCVREAPSPYTRSAVEQARRAWATLGLDPPSGHFHHLDEVQLRLEDEEFQAADIVTVGSAQAAASFGLAPFPVRVEVNPYGYDAALFPPPSTEVHQLPVAAFVGRCEPTKGIHTLLRAWRAARPDGASLLVCGTMSPVVRDVLGGLLTTPGVELLGHVQNVPAVLHRSDILVLPSFSEGSALVGYEALGAGAVPLVSEASGCPVVHDISGLVHTTGSEEELTAHLEQVLAHPSELRRLRDGALAARSSWTWVASGERLLRLYERLPGQGHAPSAASRQDR